MIEHQNIEYKQNWHDDYLKWICGFANANGGTIFIGKDDHGNITGIDDYKKLLEEIPNKVRDLMGLLVDVNLHTHNSLHFIEIITLPYTVPISLRGRYYYRSGSTKQELIGAALTEYLLRKSGKTWDEVIEPAATLEDIDDKSLQIFLHDALLAGRIADVEGLNKMQLLEKLRLVDEQGNLKRAALVLFAKDPRNFYYNCVVKIGRFGKNAGDILFHEILEGNIIQLLREVPQTLSRKFFTKSISFQGIHRIESDPYPPAAMREILLNALVHSNYLSNTHVLMRMFDDYFHVWNSGELRNGFTEDMLKKPHPSHPRNLLIAELCFRAGYIDSWGSGILKIMEACKNADLPEPEIVENAGGIMVTMYQNQFTNEQLQKFGLNGRQIKGVIYLKDHEKISNKIYQELNDCSRNTASNDLIDLVGKNILISTATRGAGSSYVLKKSIAQ